MITKRVIAAYSSFTNRQQICKELMRLQGNGWLQTDTTADFPGKTKIEKITANPLPAKQDGITVEEAKKIAEQFLAIDSDKVKLKIESIHEMDNYNGQAVISVQYMYQYGNGGSGASLEIDKNTGEIIQYYNIKDHLLTEIGENPKKESTLSQQEALTQAVNYLKEWVPSYLHNYAMPTRRTLFWRKNRYLSIYFPENCEWDCCR